MNYHQQKNLSAFQSDSICSSEKSQITKFVFFRRIYFNTDTILRGHIYGYLNQQSIVIFPNLLSGKSTLIAKYYQAQ